MIKEFKIIDSGYLKNTDSVDLKYTEWSRAYEYPHIMNFLTNNFSEKSIEIHNTCCGGHHPDHVNFLKDLEANENWNILNSDLNNYAYEGYIKNDLKSPFEFYDITQPHSKQFDVVINVSTLEEIPDIDYTDYFENCYNQLKRGGYLLITCDVPPADLYDLFDGLNIFNGTYYDFHKIINKPKNYLNYNNTMVENPPCPFGINSPLNNSCSVYYLILQKEEVFS